MSDVIPLVPDAMAHDIPTQSRVTLCVRVQKLNDFPQSSKSLQPAPSRPLQDIGVR